MTGNNDTDANFIFDLDSGHSTDFASRQLGWIYRVFAEPSPNVSNLNITALEQTRIDAVTEAALYLNLQSRDSEIGVQLLDNRKTELRESIQIIRQAMAKRERDIAVSRSRGEALEKINTSEPNPQLRYGAHVFDEIRVQMASDARELAYLRQWRGGIDALDHVLQAFDESGRASRRHEQLMRLVGQSFRAQARLRAFALSFRESLSDRLPKLQPYSFEQHFQGFLLKLPDRLIAIDRRTAAYLRHLVEAINQLAELSADFLRNRVNIPENSWFPLPALLRAIVEFFYICNFELPYYYTDLAVDSENTKQIWGFNQANQNWQPIDEDTNASRFLKRISTQATLLLTENSGLLKCHTRDELNRFLKREVQGNADNSTAVELTPYMCCGLAELDLNAANQRLKFNTAFSAIGAILSQITVDLTKCRQIAGSPFGGPLETILAMAEFEPRAFGLEGEVKALHGLERFRLLSNFWSKMGRWRAISMLGEDYAKKVTRGMESLGQPGPDHPTFLSVILKPTMASVALSHGEPITDPFASLVIADQMRLMEMINVTWMIASDFIERLKDVHSLGKLKRILEGIPQFSAEPRAELQKRFNPKWLQSKAWIWSLMRSSAPSLWDFWAKLGNEDLWTSYLKNPPLQALSALLRLFSEIGRLILLVEASGSGISERLSFNAESVAQSIIAGVEGYLEGSNMPPALAETLNYYYDPEVRFDSWLAFTTSFHVYLRQTLADLRMMNAGEPHIKGVSALIDQLEILYPNIVAADQSAVAEVMVTPPAISSPEVMGVLTEADSELFSRVFFELLMLPETETMTLLKLLSMMARKGTQDFLYGADRIHPIISRLLPEQTQRVMLFTYPTTTRNFFNFLLSLEGTSAETESTKSLMTRAADYFAQLTEFAQSLSSITERLPHILPQDREVIDNFINATAPASRDLPFLMMFACDQLVMDVCISNADRLYQIESAVGKMRAYLREQMGGQFEEPSIEIFPIGGGRIACRNNQFFLTGHNESFELAFADPDQAMSNYLLSKVASIKFSFAVQLLKKEFPQFRFIAQV